MKTVKSDECENRPNELKEMSSTSNIDDWNREMQSRYEAFIAESGMPRDFGSENFYYSTSSGSESDDAESEPELKAFTLKRERNNDLQVPSTSHCSRYQQERTKTVRANLQRRGKLCCVFKPCQRRFTSIAKLNAHIVFHTGKSME